MKTIEIVAKEPMFNTGASLGKESRPAGSPMIFYADSVGASRFFYQSKASSKEKFFFCPGCQEVLPKAKLSEHADCEGTVFQHPTQKPLELIRYLVRLVTPVGGTTLDPFMGTGTTGVAAVQQGFDFIEMDMQPEAVKIAEHRINIGREAPRKAKVKTIKLAPEGLPTEAPPSPLFALLGVSQKKS